jgi:hypothetical protein
MPGVEELELGQLQGVDGLRALRVAVNLEGPSPDTTAALGRSATTHAGLTPSA